jgi:hypothetical protein
MFKISSLVVLLRPENGASVLAGFADPCKSILLSRLHAYYRESDTTLALVHRVWRMTDASDIQ